MPHATHNARRIATSAVPHAPLKRRRSRFEQQVLLTVSVSFTMLIIVSLYAASFRSQPAVLRMADADYPRWSLLGDDFLEGGVPLKGSLTDVKKRLLRMADAGKTQAAAAAILKAKVEARVAAASGTPETPATPESP